MDALALTELAFENKAFRAVVSTTPQQQLVLMFLTKGIDIGNEKHDKATQFIFITKGKVLAVQDQDTKDHPVGGAPQVVYELKAGDSVTIPPGTWHNIIAVENTQLFTIYSPPIHRKDEYQLNKPTIGD
jgi:quercetin dioxygenase-like cupin family protein